jgi:hypothetical protein
LGAAGLNCGAHKIALNKLKVVKHDKQVDAGTQLDGDRRCAKKLRVVSPSQKHQKDASERCGFCNKKCAEQGDVVGQEKNESVFFCMARLQAKKGCNEVNQLQQNQNGNEQLDEIPIP